MITDYAASDDGIDEIERRQWQTGAIVVLRLILVLNQEIVNNQIGKKIKAMVFCISFTIKLHVYRSGARLGSTLKVYRSCECNTSADNRKKKVFGNNQVRQ